jgi:hypothetical protein
MDGYFVIGITTIPYHGFGVIINIVSKDDVSNQFTIGDIPPLHMPKLCQISSQVLGKKGKWVYYKHLCYVLGSYARWITTTTNPFMCQHVPTTRSCKNLRWLELLRVNSDASIVFTIEL